MDIKQEFREEKNMDVYARNVNDGNFSNVYVKWLEAKINYTHSCESDSELLKDKPKLSFMDWYITYGYAKSVAGDFVKEGTRYTFDEMQFKYEYDMP